MEYEISRVAGEPFLLVTLHVDVTRALVLEFAQAASAEAGKLGLPGVLVDVRQSRSAEAVFGQYTLARDLLNADVDPRLRVASVVSPEDHSHDFVETVTRNRGFNVRLFTDMEAAKAWLREDTD